MHIAVLMANTDESAFARAHPGDGEKFRVLLGQARPEWRVSVFPVKDGVFPANLAGFDGFIITGSPASARDDLPWVARLLAVIREIEALRVPLFGACFGHQAIALALGGEVAENPGGWVFGVTKTAHGGAAGWMGGDTGMVRAYAAHQEQVVVLPPGARVLGGVAACPVGSFALGDHVFTTQYHPEMTHGFVTALAEELAGVLPEAVIKAARASLVEEAEIARMRAWIIGFFEYGRG